MQNTSQTQGPDFKAEGQEIEVRLLRALAMGGKRSVEIQLLLDSQSGEKSGYQALALLLADLSVPEARARVTFEKLRAHQSRMCQELGRSVGIKTAAMDYLENVEWVLNLKDEEYVLTYTQLAQMAFQDQLSGLANFRYFTRRFHEETRRAGRYRHLLSLLFLDLDHFKQFNDRHGHVAGNRALEHVAAILKAEARETDLVARYGGEEFAVLMPETAKHEAYGLGERIRARLEQSLVEVPQAGPQKLTASLGLATYPRDAHDTETLLAAADASLYASKGAGRNRITAYEPATMAHFEYVSEDQGAAQSITVAGDFNGWSKQVDPMQPDSSGRFSLDVKLAPGRYAYKFVVNGEWYITDPLSNRSAHDGYGGRNSVMVVEARGVTGPTAR